MQDTSQIGLAGTVLRGTASAGDEARSSDDDIRSELDSRQDEVLRLLDELNAQIEAVIREFVPASPREDRLAAA